MCDPTTLAVTQGVQQSVGAYQQHYAAKAQHDYQKRLHDRQKRISKGSAVLSQAALDLRQRRERQRAARSADEVSRRASRARGVSLAGSTGGEGQSLLDVVQAFAVTETENLGIIESNLQYAGLQTEAEKEGVRAQARQEIMSSTPAPIDQTPLWLKMAGVGAGAGTTYMQLKALPTG